jgi:hypothetical protein
MKKISGLIILSMLFVLFIGCNAYQLASYYGDNDGIYVSSERGIDYEVVFSEYLQEPTDSYSSSENISQYLPWGANPESTEIVNNFFPSYGRYYYDPFYFNMGFNPYLGYGGYGFGPSFYHNLFGYEMGYPFYGHYSFYFSPFATSPGSYYWYMTRYRRYLPWYYGGMYDSIVNKYQYSNENSNTSRPSFSNSASRRGERISSNGVTRDSNSQQTRASSLYLRSAINGNSYITRNRQNVNFDVVERKAEASRNINNNLIGVYSNRNSVYNKNRSVPNLSRIKSDNIRRAYSEVRSINPSQRGNYYNRSSEYNSRLTPNYSNSSSTRYRSNSSYSNNNFSRSSNSRPTQTSGFRSSSSRSSSGVSSGSSRGGSRGGKIN